MPKSCSYKKILFCDLDGVLNSAEYFKSLKGISVSPNDRLDPEAIKHLNSITDNSGASIIVSSTWRIGYMHDLPGLKQLFMDHNIHGEVLGITPVNMNSRGAQIEEWLFDTELQVQSFVILDDDNDMGRLDRYLVQTTKKFGLQEHHVLLALDILNSKS